MTINRKTNFSGDSAVLRRRAELHLRRQRKGPRSKAGDQPRKGPGSRSAADTLRMLHELEVHQIELELQNVELQKAKDEMEAVLERYTDLYDFAPVGYLSIDAEGLILDANLTAAALLGMERSRLIRLRLERFVAPASRTIFRTFLERVFAGTKDQVCEALLLKEGGGTFWANFRPGSAVSLKGMGKSCRITFGDITVRKQAEKAQHRAEVLADTNRQLQQEIARRKSVEESLRKSQQHYSDLLKQSRHMQEQMRHLSHQILHAQEEERKRISRELHDQIAQTLTGINIRLASLKADSQCDTTGLQRKISSTQRLVEKSVDIVHQFARDLRPTVLDDLGLIPALHSFMKNFARLTGVRASLTSFDMKIDQLDSAKRTVLFRVAQEALTNVARHAHASRVEVSIRKLPGRIHMTIKDDGRSFNVERVFHSNRGKHLGLLGMRERLEMVGGKFIVESAPGKGTAILAQIPFGRARGGGRKTR